MRRSDPQRYTKQLSSILSDLVSDDDRLTVIRMGGPAAGRCSATADAGLALELDPRQRGSFKDRLDDLVSYDVGTNFAAPIRTAIEALERAETPDRLLLVIADSGGLGKCAAPLNRELQELRDDGGTIAAINLGGRGAFDGNPAFEFTTEARDAAELVEAVAEVYQRFLGVKQAQTGRGVSVLRFEVAPHVAQAYLVIAADGPLDDLTPGSANPSAAEIDLGFRGGGTTVGLDGRRRSYRIVRLQAPEAGAWEFRTKNQSSTAGWMLVQETSLALRPVTPLTPVQGLETVVELELYDRVTGLAVRESADLPGLGIEAEVGGKKHRFLDDGRGGDAAAGDGIFSARVRFSGDGDETLSLRLGSDLLDRRLSLDLEVLPARWRMEPSVPSSAEVGSTVRLTARLEAEGDRSLLEAPSRIDVESVLGNGALGNGAFETTVLLDDGSGPDLEAGDGIYTGDLPVETLGTAAAAIHSPRGARPSRKLWQASRPSAAWSWESLLRFGWAPSEGDRRPFPLWSCPSRRSAASTGRS